MIEKETEGTERGRGRKKTNVVEGRSVTMRKREVLKGKESALGREIVLEKNQRTEKARVKSMRGDIKMKKMKENIGMIKEIPRKKGSIAGAEVGTGSIGAEV